MNLVVPVCIPILCLFVHSTAGFVLNAKSASQRIIPGDEPFIRNGSRGAWRPKTRHVALWSSNKQNSSYSDDCFGLIFLTGAAVVQDPIFAAIFLILSSVGAVLTQQGRLPANKKIPGAVAGFTLLLTPLISTVLQETAVFSKIPIATNAPNWLEAVVCLFSIFYSFVLQKEKDDMGP